MKKSALLLTAFCLLLALFLASQVTGSWEADEPRDRPPKPIEMAEGELPFLAAEHPQLSTQLDSVQPTSHTGDQIVFQSYRHGNWEIYLASDNGNYAHRLTSHSGSDIHPRVNRGTTDVVFASNRSGNYELYKMKLDGSDLTRLTHTAGDEFNPAWSPDSKEIVYQLNHGNQTDLYVMAPDGGRVRRLTGDPGFDGMPSWSPDGEQIAFASTRGGVYGLWLMNADGSDKRLLISKAFIENPTWSPDGGKIAYDADGNGDGYQDLWVINIDGTEDRSLHVTYDDSDVWARSWSPDGQWVSASRIYWIYYQENWYWTEATIFAFALHQEYRGLTASLVDMYPDWQPTDIKTPSSWMEPLPILSRNDALIKWSGVDEGGAGLHSYDVQYRIGEEGSWTDWVVDRQWSQAEETFAMIPGQTVFFRVRANDRVWNREPWPASGADASTTFYNWAISGTVKDNLGIPLANAAVQTTPAAFHGAVTDKDGKFHSLVVGSEATYPIQWAKDGYLTLPETIFEAAADASFDVVLPPADNKVADWGFESQALNGDTWQAGGAFTPTIESEYLHTGQAGAFLSLPFRMEPPTYLVQTASIGNILLAGDNSGGLHLMWLDGDWLGGVLYYAHKPAGANWGEPVDLNGVSREVQFMLGVTEAGKVHVVWREYYAENNSISIYHIWRNPTGAWSEPQEVFIGGYFEHAELTELEVDADGGVHLIWGLTTSNVYVDHYYGHADATGQWDLPKPIGAESDFTLGNMTIGPAGRPHMVWCQRSRANEYFAYFYLQEDGSWSTHELTYVDKCLGSDLAIDGVGQAHVIYTNNALYHRSRATDGTWSQQTNLTPNMGAELKDPFAMLLDPQDTLHVAWTEEGYGRNCRPTYYAKLESGGQWTETATASGEGGCHQTAWLQYAAGSVYLLFRSRTNWEHEQFCLGFPGAEVVISPNCVDDPNIGGYPFSPFVDSYGNVNLASRNWIEEDNSQLSYTHSILAEAGDVSSVRQQITIPVTLTNPTLSLMYTLEGGRPGSGAGLVARIEGKSDSTVVMEADTATGWSHKWADVSAWAGQTVTLTIAARHLTNEPNVRVMLDEVALGSAPPDLWLDLHGPLNVPTGETFSLILRYGNRIPSEAHSVQVSLTFPSELSFVSADPAPIATSPSLVWNVDDFGNAVEERSIVITATMEADFTPGLWAAVAVQVQGREPEIDLTNNIDIHLVRVGYLTMLPLIAR